MLRRYVPSKWQMARLRFWAYRPSALPRTQRLFNGVTPGLLLERPLFGKRFACDVSRNGPQQLLYLEGERFISEAQLIRGLIKPHFRAIDIGANIGYMTLLMSSIINRPGSIVAIEPSPENLLELRRNVEINHLSNSIEIIEAAVGDVAGDIDLRGGINSGVAADGEAAPYRVRIDRLENLIEEPVDFIKMDIEGYEVRAINGAMRILVEQRPTLFLEVHPSLIRANGDSVEHLLQILRRIYSSTRYYESNRVGGITRKLVRQYFGTGQVTEIRDIEKRITPELDHNGSPFWMVCSP